MRRLHLSALLVALTVVPASAGPIGPDALDRLGPADVVIIGEAHGHPEHHANQRRAVAAMSPPALVFEMLSAEQARNAADAPRDDPATLAASLGWQGRGWPDFALYFPIFAAAPDAVIFGAEVPRETARRAFTEDLHELSRSLLGDLGASLGLDTPLESNEQLRRESLQAEAHCGALPAEMLPGMVAAQRLRDAAIAATILEALAVTGGPVAVITGNGHARTDWGVPALLADAGPELTVIAIGQLQTVPESPPPFDLWLQTATHSNGNPCAALLEQSSDR